MRVPVKKLAAVAAAFALSMSSTMAVAGAPAPQVINPLAVISVFGTQASAQTVCSATASTAAAAGAAVASQGQAGCVLPAADVPPPVAASGPSTANMGINWLLLGLGSLFFIAGVATLFNDDDDAEAPISPA